MKTALQWQTEFEAWGLPPSTAQAIAERECLRGGVERLLALHRRKDWSEEPEVLEAITVLESMNARSRESLSKPVDPNN